MSTHGRAREWSREGGLQRHFWFSRVASARSGGIFKAPLHASFGSRGPPVKGLIVTRVRRLATPDLVVVRWFSQGSNLCHGRHGERGVGA